MNTHIYRDFQICISVLLMHNAEKVLLSGESRLKQLVADALEGRDFGGRESLFLWREIPS